VLYRLGRKGRSALVELRRAFSMQKDPEIASHLGEVLWMLGQKDEARRYFDEATQARSRKPLAQARAEKTGA
jgi:Flp pilus assembly protein TadD